MSCNFKIILAAALVALAMVPAAIAETRDEKASVVVSYSDLNLSNRHGGETLLKRIRSAARRVCGDANAYGPLTPRAETTCRRETVAAAVAQLDIGVLTAAWNKSEPAAFELAGR